MTVVIACPLSGSDHGKRRIVHAAMRAADRSVVRMTLLHWGGAAVEHSWHIDRVMDPAIYDSLTPMERNCLRLAQHDRKSEQIAHALGIATSTVNTHIFSARRKMGGLTRLSAADMLREYEASEAGVMSSTPSTPTDASITAPPQTLSRHPMWMAGGADGSAIRISPAEVREERTTFAFDDVVLHSGGQERNRVDPLHRVLLLLAIAVLTALILIAAPAIYDSAAERIANSLERPHAR